MCLASEGQRSSGLQANEQRTVTSCFSFLSHLLWDWSSYSSELWPTALTSPEVTHIISFYSITAEVNFGLTFEDKVVRLVTRHAAFGGEGFLPFSLDKYPEATFNISEPNRQREKKNKQPHSSSSPSGVKRERVKR